LFDACVIGHVTRDIVRIGSQKKEMPGGTAYYTSMAMKSLGMNVAVITKVAKEDKALLGDLERKQIPIYLRASPRTTTFTNISAGDLDSREQLVGDIALPFTVADVEDVDSKLFHLGPLTSGDIPIEVLQSISKRSMISLDVHGFVRSIDKDSGIVKMTEWKGKEKFLRYVRILKTDEKEARIISGEENLEEMAVKLSSYGPEEVIITFSSKGSLIYCKSKFHRIPSFMPKNHVDPTGCGDTYLAGYLYQRAQGIDITKAGEVAARTASLKLENYGPLGLR